MTTFEICMLTAMGCLSVATIIVSVRSTIVEKQLKMTQHVLTHFIEATVNEVSDINQKMDSNLKSKGKKVNV